MKFQRIRALVILTTSLFAVPAFAGAAFYVDAGGAYVQMKDASQFYHGSQNSGTGYGLNLGLWTTFTNGDAPLEVQFGVDDRYEAVSSSGQSYGLNIPYPVLRLQASRIYLSFGYSPYVMSSIGGNSASSQTLQHVPGARAMMGEIGTLLPVTPRFSFGLAGTYETVSDGGIKSPNPIISGNFFMRFYFGFGDGSTTRKSNEFRGWRYPFGRDLY